MSDENPDVSLDGLPYFSGPAAAASAFAPPDQPRVRTAPPAAQHLLTAASAGSGSTTLAPEPQAEPPHPARATPNSHELSQQLDWDVIARIRSQVSTSMAEYIENHPGSDEVTQQDRARVFIDDQLTAHANSQIAGDGLSSAWTPEIRAASAAAVFDALYRLGRLQPLVDLDGAENIHIYGDDVWVKFADGTARKFPPVASSDSELISEIAFIAGRGGEAGRAFTANEPRLHIDLPGGVRLAAEHPPVSLRPAVVLRIHRLVDIDLEDLVGLETLTPQAAALLRAAVHAGQSIVVSGLPGAGKTTLVRALANSMDPMESIVTIEKERELYLDQMGDRHLLVKSLQYRPGQGERLPDGSRPGEVSLIDLLEDSLRLDTERIIVGEVRGGEINAMFQAMQAGAGSLSTLHATSASNAIRRMATLAQQGMNTTADNAYDQIAEHIRLIVQVRRFIERESGRVRRVVTEIAEVQHGETIDGARPIAAALFKADRSGRNLRPADGRPTEELLNHLIDVGFDPNLLLPREAA